MLSLPRKQMLLHPQLPPAHPVAPGWHWTGGPRESAILSADSSGETVYKSWSRQGDSPIVESPFHTESRRKGEKKELTHILDRTVTDVYYCKESAKAAAVWLSLCHKHQSSSTQVSHRETTSTINKSRVPLCRRFFSPLKFDMSIYSIFFI